MKNAATIHMGASRWDITVRNGDGSTTTLDLYRMDKDGRRRVHREFMRAYRASR